LKKRKRLTKKLLKTIGRNTLTNELVGPSKTIDDWNKLHNFKENNGKIVEFGYLGASYKIENGKLTEVFKGFGNNVGNTEA